MKEDQRDARTVHLNQKDHTCSIQFTNEPEVNNAISFLDGLVIRKEVGSLKVKVYRKKTHPDQYLNSKSHHPV